MLAPVQNGSLRYSLYVQPAPAMNFDEAALAIALETDLHANPHYRYAVELGQLAPLQVCSLDSSAGDFRAQYDRALAAAGQKLGSIKPLALERRPEAARALHRLAGSFSISNDNTTIALTKEKTA